MMKLNSVLLLTLVAIVSMLAACGGGSSSGTSSNNSSGNGSGNGSSTTNNKATLTVDGGPPGVTNFGEVDEDLAFITITVCVPGTSTCNTIDHVQVDTGSEGLRIVPSNEFNLSLPTQTSGGNQVNECLGFGDGSFIWGPVATADIQIAGEVAHSVPVQLSSTAVAPPASANAGCGTDQTSQIETVANLGANAIIGVGVFLQDCGPGCTNANSDMYFSCSTSGACNSISQSLQAQVLNPVPLFATDNNGVILELPSISANGQSGAVGNLIFGIGTQSDNAVGSAVALAPDPNTGNFAVSFDGVLYNDVFGNGPGGSGGAGFIDSGSNGLFFLDSATLTNQFGIVMADCPSSGIAQGFYCPGGLTTIAGGSSGVLAQGETANNTPVGAARPITLNVQNAVALFQTGGTAFNDVAGPNSNQFDFGLPFFFGQNVYFAFEGQSTPLGTGPLYAF
jgi:hypothetical protein